MPTSATMPTHARNLAPCVTSRFPICAPCSVT
jgi:hypothetical protein